jgi:hypothetical protein
MKLLNKLTGQLQEVPDDEADAAVINSGGTLDYPDEVELERGGRLEQFGSTGQQALGALESTVRTATFGAVPGFGTPEEIAGRELTLREESPGVSFGAQALGSAVPGLGAAGAAGRALRAVGATGKVLSAGTVLAEGAAGGLAEEVEQARFEDRPVSAGKALMWAIGGELLGRAVPAMVRSGAQRLGARLAPDAAAETVGSLLPQAERKALESAADVADGVPVGPDRDVFLVNAERQVMDTAAERMAGSLDSLTKDFDSVVDIGTKRGKLEGIVAPYHPAQRQWANAMSEEALSLREQMTGARRARGPQAVDREAYLQTFAADVRGQIDDELTDEVDDLLEASGTKAKPGSDAWKQAEQQVLEGRVASQTPIGGAPASKGFGDTPGLSKIARDVGEILKRGSKELDEAEEAVDLFITGDRMKRSLAAQEEKLTRMLKKTDVVDPASVEDARNLVRRFREQVRTDLEREDYWGRAGQYQQGINKSMADNWIPGAGIVKQDLARRVKSDFATGKQVHRFSPKRVRSFLEADTVGRDLTPDFLEQQLRGAEDALATARKFGTESEETLGRMQKSVDSVREQLKLADDVKAAKGRAAEKAGIDSESAKVAKEKARAESVASRETARAEAKAATDAANVEREAERRDDMFSAAVGAGVGLIADSFGLGAVAGMAAKALRVKKLVGTLGAASDGAIRTAARGAIRGSSARALRFVEKGADAATKVTVPVATTALARFQGSYPTPQTAFDARRRAIEAVANDPLLLPRAVATTLGDLDETDPQLYGDISARLFAMADYLRENMPSQMSASMTQPNGIPMSRATMRDIALKWNSVTEPRTVFEDVRDGLASPTQLRALEAVHPDLYEELKLQMHREVAEYGGTMPTQKKIRLDILFEGDGMAGRAFAWPLAMAIKQGRAERRQRSQGSTPNSQANTTAAPARGLTAISASVTNG